MKLAFESRPKIGDHLKSFRDHINLTKGDIVIVKLGSLSITSEKGRILGKQFREICSDILKIQKAGYLPVVVSSGAINVGKAHIKIGSSPTMAQLQTASAIGQHLLMREYQRRLGDVAQILLTHEDLKNKSRSINIRQTLFETLKNNFIPIVNENDAVSFAEISVGDNDQLSALLAQILEAKLLLMVSKTPGLYKQDPALLKKDERPQFIPFVNFDDDFKSLKTASKNAGGRGGMATKLFAIRKCTPIGIPVIITGAQDENPLLNSLKDQKGTLFLANQKLSLNKKAWILSRVKADAKVVIDEGAFKALGKNASLLPVGIKKIIGKFQRGDCIQIVYKRKIIGQGISEYSHVDAKKIIGKKSEDILQSGYPSKVFIHRNHLINR